MFMIDDEMLYDVIEKTLIPPRGGRWAGVGAVGVGVQTDGRRRE